MDQLPTRDSCLLLQHHHTRKKMHHTKPILFMFFNAFVTIGLFWGTLAELKITYLPGSHCQLGDGNESEIPSSWIIYGNVYKSCDIQINASSSSQIMISVIAANMTGTDYMYMERILPLRTYSSRYLAFMAPMEACTAFFANETIQLHFRGNIAVGITVVANKNQHFVCLEDVKQQHTESSLEYQTSSSRLVKGFDSVIRCSIKAIAWWVFHGHGQWTFKPAPSTRCDVKCPPNCSCILTDKQMIYRCHHNHTLAQNFTSLIVFTSDISRLDFSNNRISALTTNAFTNIGKHIRHLDLSSNSLLLLQIGLFANLGSLVNLNLEDNEEVMLEVGLFENLHNLIFLDFEFNTLSLSMEPGLFTGLDNLNAIDIGKNSLTTLAVGLFANLHQLEELHLTANLLVTLHSATFNGLHELRYLYLNKNQITHVNDAVFSNLTKLVTLTIAHNHLSLLPFDIFDDLLSLTNLDLSYNSFQSIPRINNIAVLNQINLLGNPLTRVTKNVFHGLTSTATVLVDKPEICICFLNGSKSCFHTIKPSPYLTCTWLLSLRALTIFNWIIGFSAFLGNAFVLWWKQNKRSTTSKVQSLFLNNLAMSDLLMGIYMIIIASADVYYGEYFPVNAESWRSGVICKLAGTLAVTSSEASVLFVTLISIDRFMHIRFPFSSNMLHVKSAKILSVMVWTFSLTLSLVASILAGGNLDFYDNSHVCIGLPLAQVTLTDTNTTEAANIYFWEDPLTFQVIVDVHESPGLYFSVAIFIAFNMLCFLLIFTSYIGIIRTISRASKAVSRKREMAEEIRMTVKVSAIILTDFFCWFPICLVGVLVQIGLIKLPPSVFAWIVTLVLPINSAINPLLYTISIILGDKCSKPMQCLPLKLGKCRQVPKSRVQVQATMNLGSIEEEKEGDEDDAR